MRGASVLLAALLASAPPAAASPCGKVAGGAKVVSRLEAAILAQDWERAADALPYFPPEIIDRMLADTSSVTERYTGCEVIFEERLPPGILRRAVAYHSGPDVAFLLYVDVIVLNGRAEIAYIRYDTDFTAILDLIR